MPYLANIVRSQGDPKVISTGRSSVQDVDRLGRALGWLSMGLGLAELLAPRRFTRALGMRGREGTFCTYGARELGAGILTLSVDKGLGLWSRVAGDALDLMTLLPRLNRRNPRRDNVKLALLAVAGITALDIFAAQCSSMRHSRGKRAPRSYADRSGFPKGRDKARQLARQLAAS